MKHILYSARATALAAVLLAGTPSFAAKTVLPDVDEAHFTNPTVITNPWVSLPVGSQFRYTSEDETEVVDITGETKFIMGVETLVQRDRVYEGRELIEDTRDYLAQDDHGNVWYFGEDVDNYENGVLVDHEGAWIAGIDGAQPGYWMPHNPTPGLTYYEEYYPHVAVDEARVLLLHAQVTVGKTTYYDCLKTENTSRLEKNATEYKYYCPQVGNVVLEEEEDGVRLELTKFRLH